MMANLSDQEREDRRIALQYANVRSSVMTIDEVMAAADKHLSFLRGDDKRVEDLISRLRGETEHHETWEALRKVLAAVRGDWDATK